MGLSWAAGLNPTGLVGYFGVRMVDWPAPFALGFSWAGRVFGPKNKKNDLEARLQIQKLHFSACILNIFTIALKIFNFFQLGP